MFCQRGRIWSVIPCTEEADLLIVFPPGEDPASNAAEFWLLLQRSASAVLATSRCCGTRYRRTPGAGAER